MYFVSDGSKLFKNLCQINRFVYRLKMHDPSEPTVKYTRPCARRKINRNHDISIILSPQRFKIIENQPKNDMWNKMSVSKIINKLLHYFLMQRANSSKVCEDFCGLKLGGALFFHFLDFNKLQLYYSASNFLILNR